MIALDEQQVLPFHFKREIFRINIRKQNYEKLFSSNRKARLQKYLENKNNPNSYLFDMVAIIKEKIELNEKLTSQEFQQMTKRIYDCINKVNSNELLDIMDASIWMIKSVDDFDLEDAVQQNEYFQQIIFKINSLAQGYIINHNIDDSRNSHIQVSAAKFLKYLLIYEFELNPFIELFAETIYFLINKDTEKLIKLGLSILSNIVNRYEEEYIEKLYQLKIGTKGILDNVCSLLCKKQTFQKDLWRILSHSLITGQAELLQKVMEIQFAIEQQEYTFLRLLIEESIKSEQKSILINQLQIVLLILEDDNYDTQKLIYEIKLTQFPLFVEGKWLFDESNQVSTLAHELQVYLIDKEQID